MGKRDVKFNFIWTKHCTY